METCIVVLAPHSLGRERQAGGVFSFLYKDFFVCAVMVHHY